MQSAHHLTLHGEILVKISWKSDKVGVKGIDVGNAGEKLIVRISFIEVIFDCTIASIVIAVSMVIRSF